MIVLHFWKKSVKLLKYTEFSINALFPPIIQGHRNAPSQKNYSFSLQTYPPSIHKANTTINAPSIWDRIDFYHVVLLSPIISIWRKAIKNGFLKSWTDLIVIKLTKYIPNYEATVKFHMHAQRCNICSTKKAPFSNNMDATILTPNPIRIISKNK